MNIKDHLNQMKSKGVLKSKAKPTKKHSGIKY